MLRLALVALVLSVSLLVGACSAAEEDENSQRRRGAPPSPLFYEIARDDGIARGWIFGTIHALPDGTEWRTSAIVDATARADRLVVEVASLQSPGETARVFQELAATPDLPPLIVRVPAEQRADVAQLADEAGLSVQRQRTTESWAAALIIARLQATGDPGNGVDRALLADFASRPVRELEGARVQLGIFDRLPETEQRSLLSAVISASKEGDSAAEHLRSAWLSGDLAALEAASRRGIMADPRLRESLLLARNKRWLPLIEAELEAPGRPLVAVGAAHLVGPEGLIALLEARGWRLRRRV